MTVRAMKLIDGNYASRLRLKCMAKGVVIGLALAALAYLMT